MELLIFFSLLFTSLAFLAAGCFAYLKPQILGGDFKLVKNNKAIAIKHSTSSNEFVIRSTKTVGWAIMAAGLLMTVFSIAYLFYPEILLVFSYAK